MAEHVYSISEYFEICSGNKENMQEWTRSVHFFLTNVLSRFSPVAKNEIC